MTDSPKPNPTTAKLLDDCCAQMAELIDARKELSADIKELKERIEETMIAGKIPEWEHAGVKLQVNESVKVTAKSAKADDDND